MVGLALCAGSCLLAQDSSLAAAKALYARTEYRAALAALKSSPAGSTPAGLELAGKVRFGLGEHKEAADLFARACQSDPRNSSYWMWLGRAWGRRAESANPLMAPSYATRARESFEKALQLNPADKEAGGDLFTYYLEAPGFLGGGLEKARALAERQKSLDPAEYEYRMAELAIKQKDWDSAEQRLRRSAKLAESQLGRVVELAKFLARRGRTSESDKLFEQALAAAPASPTAVYARAQTYIETGREPAKARSLLKQYLAMPRTPDDPTPTEARELIKKLGDE